MFAPGRCPVVVYWPSGPAWIITGLACCGGCCCCGGKDNSRVGLLLLLLRRRHILRAIAMDHSRGIGIVVSAADKHRVCENIRRGVGVGTEAAAKIVGNPPDIRPVTIDYREKIPAANIDATGISATQAGTRANERCATEHWGHWGSTGKDGAAEIAYNARGRVGGTAREDDAAKAAMYLAEHTGA